MILLNLLVLLFLRNCVGQPKEIFADVKLVLMGLLSLTDFDCCIKTYYMIKYRSCKSIFFLIFKLMGQLSISDCYFHSFLAL